MPLKKHVDVKNKKTVNRNKGEPDFLTPSRILLDPLPSAPSSTEPHQRIIGKIDRSALTLYLQILASSDYVLPNPGAFTDSISPETVQKQLHAKKEETRKLGDRIIPTPKRESNTFLKDEATFNRDFLFQQTLALGISEVVRKMLIKRELSLADFRPHKAPFVPYILKVLVNAIEDDSKNQGWDDVYSPSAPSQVELAELHACLLLQNSSHHHHVKRQVNALPLPLKVHTLRVLLSGFKQKPIHFSKNVLKEVIKRPLYDLFLRPNPNIKSLVRHTALPCSRTTMDTLAFMMFHLQHAWKECSPALANKATLAKLYGPLLVSFSERPIITDQDPLDYKTEEAAILEVVLEVCDLQFWDNLSMLKMHLAFQKADDIKEEEETDTLEDLEVRTTVEPSEYENEDWFSNLFEVNICRPKKPPVLMTQDDEMPWGSTIFADCRHKPEPPQPPQETGEQRIERAKREVGSVLDGLVLDIKKPGPNEDVLCQLPLELDGALLHHSYLRRDLRDAPAILKDAMMKARLSKSMNLPSLGKIIPRIKTHLIAPPENPRPPPSSLK